VIGQMPSLFMAEGGLALRLLTARLRGYDRVMVV